MTIEDMMRLHAGDVRRRVLRLVGPEAVDDVCQDVWVRVWRYLPGYRGDAKPSVWLYRVATNTALSWYRHRVRTPQATVALPEFDDAAASEVFIDRDADPERRCVARLMAARVLRRVSRLPRLRRAALVTQVRTGSPREGAEVLGLNYDTFKSRVWRARRDLAGWD